MFSAFLWGGLAAASLLVGYFLSERQLKSRTIGIVMGFGAGAVLTMLADAMMPEACEHGGKTVGIFTVMGFLMAAVLAILH